MVPEVTAAVDLLRSASSLIVGAGAGMGVDSGLPDFRGKEGFWRAYPPLAKLGIEFTDAASPALFQDNPRLAWGFYGHRAALYRKTEPHAGFGAVLEIARRLEVPWYVVTSNVDGHFQRAGFEEARVFEVHGSIHHLQCAKPCCHEIWENEYELDVDEATLELRDPVPGCPYCQRLARPCILMFDDEAWVNDRSQVQHARYWRFVNEEAGAAPVFLELGAGTAVPTIRYEGERLAARSGASVVRVNVRESEVEPPGVGVAAGAMEVLLAMRDAVVS